MLFCCVVKIKLHFHHFQINGLVACVGNDEFVATACADGSLKLWTMESRDQAAQFLVIGQVISKDSGAPKISRCMVFRSFSIR